ncbi:hypothetical protein PT277_04520 [Acetobacteraceae bacterium ESL0709]|nr:hypothetical protein [Acetobacteraceae bacterium ESL0697]MDF7677960.1 hypothetical protein [Acetobacteraceae bacterium ESL0709]
MTTSILLDRTEWDLLLDVDRNIHFAQSQRFTGRSQCDRVYDTSLGTFYAIEVLT